MEAWFLLSLSLLFTHNEMKGGLVVCCGVRSERRAFRSLHLPTHFITATPHEPTYTTTSRSHSWLNERQRASEKRVRAFVLSSTTTQHTTGLMVTAWWVKRKKKHSEKSKVNGNKACVISFHLPLFPYAFSFTVLFVLFPFDSHPSAAPIQL